MKRKGISLIVLIIIIVVIIILATAIIVNLAKTNIIDNAKNAVQKSNESQINAKAQLLLADYMVDKLKGVTLEEFLEDKKRLKEIDDYQNNDDGTYKVIIDGYYFTFDEGGKNVSEAKVCGDIEIGYKINEFLNGKLKVTVTIKSDGTNIQSITKPNGENLTYGNVKVATIEEQIDANVVYSYEVTLVSGVNSTQTIIYEDNEAPTVSIKPEKTEIYGSGQTISADITITDEKSDVNIDNCKWVLSKEASTSVLNESDYTESFSNTTQKITTSAITEYGSYYIHVLAKDNVGNYDRVVSQEIVVKDGTMISTPQDLQNINATGNYFVVNDIDMTGFDFKPITKIFKGTLDGLGHTISNLTISGGDYIGIFKKIGSCTIKNILFKDVNISSTGYRVGLIAGGIYNNDNQIKNINIEKVGITGNISGTGYIGSFIGSALLANINFTNCYSRANLTGNSYDTGGFIYNNSERVIVDKCYFAGTISAKDRVGVFVTSSANTTITNSYYDGNLFTISVPAKTSGTKLSTDEMSDPLNFPDFDFESTWKMDEKAGYPELRF